MEPDIVVVVFNKEVSHENEQQRVLVDQVATAQLGAKGSVVDILEHFQRLDPQTVVRQLAIVHLLHQSVEAVEEGPGVGHRLYLVDVWLVFAQGREHIAGHTVAERTATARGTKIMFGLKHVDFVGQTQNLGGATTKISCDLRYHNAAVLAAVDEYCQQNHLYRRQFELAHSIFDMRGGLAEKVAIKC